MIILLGFEHDLYYSPLARRSNRTSLKEVCIFVVHIGGLFVVCLANAFAGRNPICQGSDSSLQQLVRKLLQLLNLGGGNDFVEHNKLDSRRKRKTMRRWHLKKVIGHLVMAEQQSVIRVSHARSAVLISHFQNALAPLKITP